jgi:hypothetical protein
MRRPAKKATVPPPFRPDVGKVYRITNYHTGDFVATCVEQLFQTARYRVKAPLASALNPGEEIEIAYRSPCARTCVAATSANKIELETTILRMKWRIDAPVLWK